MAALFLPRACAGNYVARFIASTLDRTGPKRDAGRVEWRAKKRMRGALTMSDQSASESGPVSFGQRLASSQVFTDLFREGMGLVEETAAYLDGDGRQESKKLERAAALAYATESMRLTTRLMQLASWLLLHRAVNEGEMSLAQANKEKVKVKFATSDAGGDPDAHALLPLRLQELIARSRELQLKVLRLDASIHAPAFTLRAKASNPVERQLGLLKAAFEQDGA
jgi:regulator of CtrA degradation